MMSEVAALRSDLVARAAQLLGGQRALAEALAVNERSVRMWIAGDRPVRDSVLREIGTKLARHSEACLALSDAVLDVLPPPF